MGLPSTSVPPTRLSHHDLPKNRTASGAAGFTGQGRPADRPEVLLDRTSEGILDGCAALDDAGD